MNFSPLAINILALRFLRGRESAEDGRSPAVERGGEKREIYLSAIEHEIHNIIFWQDL